MKKKGISQNPDITEVVAILVVACVICCGLQFFNLNGLTFGTIFAFFATGCMGMWPEQRPFGRRGGYGVDAVHLGIVTTLIDVCLYNGTVLWSFQKVQ